MNKTNIETFTIIGIKVRTTNENGQSAKDKSTKSNKYGSRNFYFNYRLK